MAMMNFLRREPVGRHLAAILAADAAGYSRLMNEAEEGTLAALRAWRRDIAEPRIRDYRGRIVKSTGDGALARRLRAVVVTSGPGVRDVGRPA